MKFNANQLVFTAAALTLGALPARAKPPEPPSQGFSHQGNTVGGGEPVSWSDAGVTGRKKRGTGDGGNDDKHLGGGSSGAFTDVLSDTFDPATGRIDFGASKGGDVSDGGRFLDGPGGSPVGGAFTSDVHTAGDDRVLISSGSGSGAVPAPASGVLMLAAGAALSVRRRR